MSGDVEDAVAADDAVDEQRVAHALASPHESFRGGHDDDDGTQQRLGLLAPRDERARSDAHDDDFTTVSLDVDRHDDGRRNDNDASASPASTMTYHVDDALDTIGFGKFQLYMLAFAGFAWCADAMEMMLLSFIGPSMRCEFGVDADAEGALTSVVFVGMMLGAPGWGVLSDARGRKTALLFATVATLIGGVGSALAPSFAVVLLFRWLVGVGLGGVPVAYGLFTEFLPSASRGVNLVLINLFWTLGSMLESALAWMVLPQLSWRVLLLLSTAPLFGLIVCVLLVPESPLYSMSANRADDAKATLRRVAETNGKSLPRGTLIASVSSTRDEDAMEASTPYDERTFGQKYVPKGLRALLGAKHRKTSLLVWFIFFGVAFLYYGVVLLNTQLHVMDSEDSDGDIKCLAHGAPDLSNSEYFEIFLDSFAEVPGVILAALCIDRIGRKKTMSYTLSLTGVMLFPLAFSASTNGAVRDFLLFITRSSAFAAFTAIYVFSAEIYPTHMRSSGIGVSNGWARIGGMMCPFFAVSAVESGQLTLSVIVFVVVAALSAVCASALDVETAGRKLDAEEPGIELTPVQISS